MRKYRVVQLKADTERALKRKVRQYEAGVVCEYESRIFQVYTSPNQPEQCSVILRVRIM